jgi:hypothetical protein
MKIQSLHRFGMLSQVLCLELCSWGVNNAMLICNGHEAMLESTVDYYSCVPLVYLHLVKKLMAEAIYKTAFLAEHCYWLIMHCGCKLSYDWSSYTILVEEWTRRMSCGMKLLVYCSRPFMSHKAYKSINI